jgi:hypothetical protein
VLLGQRNLIRYDGLGVLLGLLSMEIVKKKNSCFRNLIEGILSGKRRKTKLKLHMIRGCEME